MKRIYTFGGFPATRNLTVADIKAVKGKQKFVQTTAVNRIEAAAAQTAGIDHLSIVDHDLADVRAGAPDTMCGLNGVGRFCNKTWKHIDIFF